LAVIGKQIADGLRHHLLFVGKSEVHRLYPRGRPSMRSAMMFF
jgi:hypothetical protein